MKNLLFKSILTFCYQSSDWNWAFFLEINLVFCKRIVEAVFLSVLDYRDVIYGRAASSTLKPLDAVYHSAFRFITGDSYGTHRCLLYQKKLNRLLKRWGGISICSYLFIKQFYKSSPSYLSVLFSWNAGSHCTRSQTWLTLIQSWEDLLSVTVPHILGICFKKSWPH